MQKIFQAFGRFSGLRINFSKSEILLLTKVARGDWVSHIPLKLSGASIKYLGVNIGWEPSLLYSLNFLPLIDKIVKELEMWKNLPISLSGRAYLFKMVSFACLLYLLRTVPLQLQQKHVTRLTEALKKFLWQGKRPRINMQNLFLSKGEGGIGLPNIRNYKI